MRVEVVEVERPLRRGRERDLEYLLASLGFGVKTAYYVMKEVIVASREGKEVTTTRIAEKYGLARGTVLYQVKKLEQSGLIVKKGRGWTLRERNMRRTLEKIRRDIMSLFEELYEIAEEIDREFELPKEVRE